MNWTRYRDNLRERHRQSLSQTAGPGAADLRLNLFMAGASALAALLLFAIGGYRAGFEPVHDLGLYFSIDFLESLTYAGDTLLAICLAALFAKRQPRVLWMAVLASLYATALSRSLKALVNASRPPAVLGDWLTVIGPVWKTHSFPSGHTVTAFVFAACFAVGAPRSAKLLFFILAAAVGLSRVWVGVHWPVDVLAGAAVAAVSAALAIRTMKSTNWGLGLAPHLFFVAAIAACCVAELIRIPEYPLARPLAILIALFSLLLLARDYVFRPLKQAAQPR